MRPPDRYNVSPLPSWATVSPDTVPRYVSFSETIRAIWRHLTGRPRPTQRERWLAELAVERLAEEMDAETEGEPETSFTAETSFSDESHGRNEAHDGSIG
jgi:hypothetical protein